MSELKKTDQFDVKERCRELSEYMFTILEKNKDALDANTLSYVAFGIPMISVEVMRRIDDHKSHLQTEILKSAEKNLLGCKGYKGTEELLVDRRLFFAFYSTIEDYGKRTEVRDELLKKVRALALAFAGTNHNSKVDVDKSIKFITGLITYCAVNEYEEVYKLEEQGVFRGFSSQIDECSESTMKQIAEEKKAKADKIRKDRTNKSIKLVALIVGVILLGVIAAKFVLPEIQYNRACSLYELNEYDEAIAKFEELKGYKDSNVKLLDCWYDKACALKNEGKYDEAIGIFEDLEGYKDSEAKMLEAEDARLSGWIDEDNQWLIKNKPKVGGVTYFGRFEGHIIPWQVLAIKGNKALIITNNIIKFMPYNDTDEAVTWYKSSLRAWLAQ